MVMQKLKKLIEDLKAKKVNITGYRIRNMGKSDSSQKFMDILKAIPDEIQLLELFFSAGSSNTSSLIALENKHIKELGIYTLGNSLLDKWSINPNALRKVEWINSNDYNVSWDYKQGADIATRITFDTLAFDPVDYNENASTLQEKLKRINDGMRMVYWVRNNEPIFEGGFGPGLEPDHKEDGNSYPQGLDFTRIPKIRSLRGLEFHDKLKPSNSKSRMIRRLTLYNNSEAFNISGEELNEAGFNKHIVSGEPGQKSKILFSNGNLTTKVRITGTSLLNSEGIDNLSRLYMFAEQLKKEIIVDNNASALKSQLEGLGYSVKTSSSSDSDGEFI